MNARSVERSKEIAHRLVGGFSVDGDIDAAFALLPRGRCVN
ncbi:hypothetical protein [Streptomyces atroolivaceus]